MAKKKSAKKAAPKKAVKKGNLKLPGKAKAVKP